MGTHLHTSVVGRTLGMDVDVMHLRVAISSTIWNDLSTFTSVTVDRILRFVPRQMVGAYLLLDPFIEA